MVDDLPPEAANDQDKPVDYSFVLAARKFLAQIRPLVSPVYLIHWDGLNGPYHGSKVVVFSTPEGNAVEITMKTMPLEAFYVEHPSERPVDRPAQAEAPGRSKRGKSQKFPRKFSGQEASGL